MRKKYIHTHKSFCISIHMQKTTSEATELLGIGKERNGEYLSKSHRNLFVAKDEKSVFAKQHIWSALSWKRVVCSREFYRTTMSTIISAIRVAFSTCEQPHKTIVQMERRKKSKLCSNRNPTLKENAKIKFARHEENTNEIASDLHTYESYIQRTNFDYEFAKWLSPTLFS